MKLRSLLFSSVLAMLVPLGLASGAPTPSELSGISSSNYASAKIVNISEAYTESLGVPAGLAMTQGRYYVTDQRGNVLLAFDSRDRLLAKFGTAGSGKGEFIHPTTLSSGPDGQIYVRDLGNDRIEFFDLAGRYTGEIKAQDFSGFAISGRNEIMVGLPQDGALVTVYDRRGHEIRKIGKLRKTSEFYGPASRGDDLRNQVLINRVNLAAGEQGTLYVTFLFAPVVQKYDADGRLLWERRLGGPDIETLTSLFLSDEGRAGRKFVRLAMDGRAANLVTAACGFDPVVRRLYILLPNRRLMSLNPDGSAAGLFELRSASQKTPMPLVLGSVSNNVLALVDPFNQVVWRGSLTQ